MSGASKLWVVGGVVLVAMVMASLAQAAPRHEDDDERGRAQGRDHGRDFGRDHRAPAPVAREHGRGVVAPPLRPAPPPVRYELDRHWNHDRYYPRRGEVIRVMPSDSVSVSFGGLNFFFQGGIWMRPNDGHFRVVSPPVGIVLPMLPTMAVSLRHGDVTLFYANGTYYQAHRHGGFVVVPAPVSSAVVVAESGVPPPAPVVVRTLPAPRSLPDPIIYPRNGQSPEAQEADLQACNRWATSVPAAMAEAEAFQRAVSACMDGRGYTVR